MLTIDARNTVAAGLLALLLAGCAGEPGPRTGAGIATGAVAGGLIGAAATGRGRGALTGALIGGVLGGMVGNALDEDDRRRAYAAQMEALEYGGPGTPHSWRGDRGNYGTIVAGPAYAQGTYARCREYTHTVYVGGRPEIARGVACRNPDGTWAPIS
jgi:surface antigen